MWSAADVEFKSVFIEGRVEGSTKIPPRTEMASSEETKERQEPAINWDVWAKTPGLEVLHIAVVPSLPTPVAPRDRE